MIPNRGTWSRLSEVRAFLNNWKQFFKWRLEGSPAPPPHFVKQLTVRRFRKASSFDVLVESGTYLGNMVEAQRKSFRKIFSIELSQPLFEGAVARFRGQENIKIMQGDSSEVLKSIVAQLDGSAIFWLDGHYSGGETAKGRFETPVMSELEAIFASNNEHIILIDDARLFNGSHDYPTLGQLGEVAREVDYSLVVDNDIICLTKNGKNW